MPCIPHTFLVPLIRTSYPSYVPRNPHTCPVPLIRALYPPPLHIFWFDHPNHTRQRYEPQSHDLCLHNSLQFLVTFSFSGIFLSNQFSKTLIYILLLKCQNKLRPYRCHHDMGRVLFFERRPPPNRRSSGKYTHRKKQ